HSNVPRRSSPNKLGRGSSPRPFTFRPILESFLRQLCRACLGSFVRRYLLSGAPRTLGPITLRNFSATEQLRNLGFRIVKRLLERDQPCQLVLVDHLSHL